MFKTHRITAAMLACANALLIPTSGAQIINVWSDAPATAHQMFQKGIGTDRDGNVYTVSGFRGPVDFGRGPISPPTGERGLLLAKYDASGFHLSALGTGYSADTLIFDMSVDHSGNIYVVGHFEDTDIDLGGGPIPNTNGNTESFIVKYDAFGRFQWAHAFDTESSSNFRFVEADPSGNVYLFGSQNSGLDFGGGVLTSGGFLVKYNTVGVHQWSKMLPSLPTVAGIAADGTQSIVITDQFFGDIDLGGGTISGTGSGDFYVAKFDASNGAHEWSTGFAAGTPRAIAVDSSGAVSLTATGNGTIDFGGGPLTNTAIQAMYLAKFDTDGEHLWSRISSTTATTLDAPGLAANAFGETYVVGYSNAAIDLGDGDRSAAFGMLGFFAYFVKYDIDGNHVWSDAYGSTESVFASSIAIDDANRVFLGGGYTGVTDIGSGPLENPDSTNISFVAGFFDTSVLIGGGDCFIATAAYGTPMADELNVFRQVRDRFLLRSAPGTALVNAYYAVSPPVAGIIDEHPSLRTATRYALTPVYHYSRAFLAAPWLVVGASILCAVGCMIGMVRLRRYFRNS